VGDSPRESRFAASLGIVDLVPGPPAWTLLDPDPGGAVRVGAAPVLDLPPAPASVEEDTTERPRRREPVRSAPGRVLAVWGPAGAPGRTSLAVALAAELAAAGRSVAVGDADTHAAAVAPALGLLDEAPGFAAACRLAPTGALPTAALPRGPVPHRSGFRRLTRLGRPSRSP